METRLAELLGMIAEPDGDEALRAALVNEKPLGEETLSALFHIFVSASGEPASGSGKTGLGSAHLRSAEVAISVLKDRRDYETLFNLAVFSSAPGRPRLLAERCIDATLQAGEKADLYSLALGLIPFGFSFEEGTL